MWASDHIPEEILIAYADDPDSHREIERHLELCDECRRIANTHHILGAGLRRAGTWRFERELTTQRDQLEFRNLIDAQDAEDAEAEQILKPVLETPYSLAYAHITAKPRFRTAGVVRRLMAAALDQCHKDPKYALVLAATAQLIVELLPKERYSAEVLNNLKGNFWKDFATVYRYLGQFEDAYKTLARAQKAFEELSDEGMGLAAVKHGRALILHLQQRNAEALPLARQAAQEYGQRKESLLYLEAQETIAIVSHELGDVATAYSLYRNAYELADDLDQGTMKARCAKGLGLIARDRGDFGTASRHFLEALQLYQALGKDAMVVRMRWSIARLSLMAGNPRTAAARLLEIRSALAEKGMMSDAAEVDLDRAEAHLMLREYDVAYAICEGLPAVFIQANMLTGALTAAAYLREAADLRRLTRSDVQLVRNYLTQLERRPDLEFVRPDSR